MRLKKYIHSGIFILGMFLTFFIISINSVTALTIQQTPGTVTLFWNDTSTNEIGFLIERKSISNNFIQIAAVNSDTTQYTDSSIAQLTTYEYRVASYSGSGTSAYSNTVQVNTPLFVCGNNYLQTGEECDDGNLISGDGCSATCTTESNTGGGGATGGSGGSLSGGGGGVITGNIVSSEQITNNTSTTPEVKLIPPKINLNNSTQTNQSQKIKPSILGKFIEGFSDEKVNQLSLALLGVTLCIGSITYFLLKRK